jgi:hypothetical protein
MLTLRHTPTTCRSVVPKSRIFALSIDGEELNEKGHHFGEPSFLDLLRFLFHQCVFHIYHGQDLVDLFGGFLLHPG